MFDLAVGIGLTSQVKPTKSNSRDTTLGMIDSRGKSVELFLLRPGSASKSVDAKSTSPRNRTEDAHVDQLRRMRCYMYVWKTNARNRIWIWI